MVRCWGHIYGDKIQQNLRKWLENKYNIKKLDLHPQNQRQLKDVYGQKKDGIIEKDKSMRKDEKIQELIDQFKSDKAQSYSSNKKILCSDANNNKKSNNFSKNLLQALQLD